jgi:hypothetical protein
VLAWLYYYFQQASEILHSCCTLLHLGTIVNKSFGRATAQGDCTTYSVRLKIMTNWHISSGKQNTLPVTPYVAASRGEERHRRLYVFCVHDGMRDVLDRFFILSAMSLRASQHVPIPLSSAVDVTASFAEPPAFAHSFASIAFTRRQWVSFIHWTQLCIPVVFCCSSEPVVIDCAGVDRGR